MAKLKKGDFYYGAMLSYLMREQLSPALIESGEARRVYEITGNNGNFRLFAKYRGETNGGNGGRLSWTFSLTQDELEEIKRGIQSSAGYMVGLICARSALGDSEIVFLDKEVIGKILAIGKQSITVGREKGEKKYRVYIDRVRSDEITIPFTPGFFS